MRPPPLLAAAALATALTIGLRADTWPAQEAGTPEARAVAFLSVEVPRWHAENGCYSCHNNGDAVRALVAASRGGLDVAAPLADTLAFLGRPQTWADNSRGGEFDDQTLARVQFAGALVDAAAAGLAPRDAIPAAARLVAADQQDDGSWRLDPSRSLGSPATYGTALATWSARRTLEAAGQETFEAVVARADAWIRSRDPQVLPDLAAALLMTAEASDAAGVALRADALNTLLGQQQRSGGWGPYPTVRPEPFDTALALLALAAQPRSETIDSAIARGRAWLRDAALPDGSWPETTRPAGQRSYAQLISTTGWATVALFELRRRDGATNPPAILSPAVPDGRGVSRRR
jgi:hypothetical protein